MRIRTSILLSAYPEHPMCCYFNKLGYFAGWVRLRATPKEMSGLISADIHPCRAGCLKRNFRRNPNHAVHRNQSVGVEIEILKAIKFVA